MNQQPFGGPIEVRAVEEDDEDNNSVSTEAEFTPARHRRRFVIAISVIGITGLAVALTLAYSISGAYFLYRDYLKGGLECSKTSGFKVWMYCLVNVAFIPANINSCRATYKTHHTKLRIMSLLVNLCIEAMFVAYGSLVLFHPGPCQKFKTDARGLWLWAKFAYNVKICCLIFVGLAIVILFIYYTYRHILRRHHARNQQEFGDIPLAEVEINTPQLRINFVEDNPEPMIVDHPAFTSTNRLSQAAVIEPNAFTRNLNNQREPLLTQV